MFAIAYVDMLGYFVTKCNYPTVRDYYCSHITEITKGKNATY